MELWMSGEVQIDVYPDFCRAMKVVTARINARIRKRDYGAGLKEWAFIAIIRRVDSPYFGEVMKYSKRSRDAEFRLKIDHKKFKASAESGQQKLLFKSLVRCVRLMSKVGVRDVTTQQLLEDILKVGRMNAWC